MAALLTLKHGGSDVQHSRNFSPLRARFLCILLLTCLSNIIWFSAQGCSLLWSWRGCPEILLLVSYNNDNEKYMDEEIIPTGILSEQPPSFFRKLQDEIDRDNHTERCLRYGFYYNATHPRTPRRIFYGSLIANEPRELLEIVSTESYGIFEGVVFVESNRTPDLTPRPFLRLNYEATLKRLFGTSKVQVRTYVEEEDQSLKSLARENMQRHEILAGWKELGMMPQDMALLTDTDEILTRDFLRALQLCDGIQPFDYEKHQCLNPKIVTSTMVFETSPECITKDYIWFHPDIVPGFCVESIGNDTTHQIKPWRPHEELRKAGKATTQRFSVNDTNGDGRYYPLWAPYDFRLTSGGAMHFNGDPKRHGYTAYHFHNFFANFNATRHKYHTFGHARGGNKAYTESLDELGDDLQMMYRCVKNWTAAPDQKRVHVEGGFDSMLPPMPIYFQDEKYRKRKHQQVLDQLQADELLLDAMRQQQQG